MKEESTQEFPVKRVMGFRAFELLHPGKFKRNSPRIKNLTDLMALRIDFNEVNLKKSLLGEALRFFKNEILNFAKRSNF